MRDAKLLLQVSSKGEAHAHIINCARCRIVCYTLGNTDLRSSKWSRLILNVPPQRSLKIVHRLQEHVGPQHCSLQHIAPK